MTSPLRGAVPEPPRERQALVAEIFHGRHGGAGAAERLEQHSDRVLHLLIRVEHHPSRGVVNEADRHAALQFAAPRFVQHAPNQPGAEHVEFRFAHGALQAQQQAIIEMRGIVHPVFIQDERVGQRADLQEPMPVRRVAREARDLQAHDDPARPMPTSVTKR